MQLSKPRIRLGVEIAAHICLAMCLLHYRDIQVLQVIHRSCSLTSAPCKTGSLSAHTLAYLPATHNWERYPSYAFMLRMPVWSTGFDLIRTRRSQRTTARKLAWLGCVLHISGLTDVHVKKMLFMCKCLVICAAADGMRWYHHW